MLKQVMLAALVALITSLSIGAQTENALPIRAKNYLKANYPGWSIGESWIVDKPRVPAVEKGDFNGDGQTDVAVVIKKDDRTYAIVLLATRTSYKAVNLLAQGRDDTWIAGIDVVSRGTRLEGLEDSSKTLRTKTDSILLYDGEGMGRIYQWQGGAFKWMEGF